MQMSTLRKCRIPGELLEWWPIMFGLLALYLPTFYRLANGIWSSEEQAHGPLILMVVLYIFWQKRDAFILDSGRSASFSGSLILLAGLFFYFIGSSQSIVILEVGSFPLVIAGTLLIMRGWGSIQLVWFALMFSIFMVPLPGFFVDVVTAPLKSAISDNVETLLYHLDYPIARNGVVLSIGPYQLLVADACSGLHSMFSLSALGFLYLYLMQHVSRWRNALLVAAILPIAFIVNVLRVIVLVLVTYYLGDEAGQGFLHGFAGMVLFIAALISLLLLDKLLGLFKLFKDVPAKPKHANQGSGLQ